jgi:ZIP family zinc transporter
MNAILYTLIPVGAAVGSAIIAAHNRPSEQFQSCVQHFAAGIIFAAVATQLVPPVRNEPPLVAIGGFLAGIATMMLLRQLSQRMELSQYATTSAGFIAASMSDVFIDGVVLGATFIVGTKQGVLLTIALTLSLFFLGLSVAVTLSQAGMSRRGIVARTTIIALSMPVGTALGAASLQSVSSAWRGAVLAFGSVVLMYLVTEELLVRAHKVQRAAWAMPLFFVGFLIFLVLVEVMG